MQNHRRNIDGFCSPRYSKNSATTSSTCCDTSSQMRKVISKAMRAHDSLLISFTSMNLSKPILSSVKSNFPTPGYSQWQCRRKCLAGRSVAGIYWTLRTGKTKASSPSRTAAKYRLNFSHSVELVPRMRPSQKPRQMPSASHMIVASTRGALGLMSLVKTKIAWKLAMRRLGAT